MSDQITQAEIERLEVLLAKATLPPPWKDFTTEYGKAVQARKKRDGGRAYHARWAKNDPLVLVAQDNHHGEPINPEHFPDLVDWWDLKKILALRWCDVKGKMFDATGHMWEEHRALMIGAVNALPALLAAARENVRLTAERDRLAEALRRISINTNDNGSGAADFARTALEGT